MFLYTGKDIHSDDWFKLPIDIEVFNRFPHTIFLMSQYYGFLIITWDFQATLAYLPHVGYIPLGCLLLYLQGRRLGDYCHDNGYPWDGPQSELIYMFFCDGCILPISVLILGEIFFGFFQ